MSDEVKYKQEDLERAQQQEIALLSNELRKLARPVTRETAADGLHAWWTVPEVDWESLAETILQRDESVRAEAQQAFSAECGRFHNEGPKCATCGRFDRDARLAAAEKLARAALGVPSPDEEGVCVAGCGKMDLCEETIVQHSGDSYKRYFFKHVICWYAQLVEALAEWKEAVK